VAGQNARLARRRRFRFMRTGALLLVVGVMRLSQIGRSRWRISLGLCGVLLEVLGHLVFTGQARGVADLLGLAVVLFAWLKSADPAQDRAVVQQAAWRWQG
jgi:membrane-bound ClpP family serine protease